MKPIPVDIRDTITFVVQKTFSIIMGVLGIMRIATGFPPTETALAIVQYTVGAVMLAVAAALEVSMWRARPEALGKVLASHHSAEDRLADRMQLLERALIDRLPPSID